MYKENKKKHNKNMKKILIKSFKICTLIVLALVVCLTNFNIGKNVVKAEENLIIVAGTGKIEVEPDIAIIEIGCQTIDKEISEAVNKNNEIMKNIKEYLITSGIEENKIATKNYYIYPKYKYIALEENFIGYQVDNIIKVIIEDLDNIGIIQGVTDLGANKISNVEFACSNEEELYNEALKRAVENAKRSEERRVGKECRIGCRSRWSPYH